MVMYRSTQKMYVIGMIIAYGYILLSPTLPTLPLVPTMLTDPIYSNLSIASMLGLLTMAWSMILLLMSN